MITLYTSPRSRSALKAQHWLTDHQLPFIIRNIFDHPLSYQEFQRILRLTEKGTDDIITTRAKSRQRFGALLNDSLTLNALFELVKKHPALLHYPLIIDEKRLQIGYNTDDIRQFLPRSVRTLELLRAQRLIA